MVSKTKQVANKQQNKGVTKKPEFKPAQKQQQVAKNGNKQVAQAKKAAPVVPAKGNNKGKKQPVKVKNY